MAKRWTANKREFQAINEQINEILSTPEMIPEIDEIVRNINYNERYITKNILSKQKDILEALKAEQNLESYFDDWENIPSASMEMVENLKTILSAGNNENVSQFLAVLLQQEIENDTNALLSRLDGYGEYPIDLANSVAYESDPAVVKQDASKLANLITGTQSYNKDIDELTYSDPNLINSRKKGSRFKNINFLDKKADYEEI
jgi:hypothetical protein